MFLLDKWTENIIQTPLRASTIQQFVYSFCILPSYFLLITSFLSNRALRGPSVNKIGSYEFLWEVMNCKMKYFWDFEISTKPRHSDILNPLVTCACVPLKFRIFSKHIFYGTIFRIKYDRYRNMQSNISCYTPH